MRVNLIQPAEHCRDLRARGILADECLQHFFRGLRPAGCEACIGLRERRGCPEVLRNALGRRSVRCGNERREIGERRAGLPVVKMNSRADVAPPVFVARRFCRGIEQAARLVGAAKLDER